MKFLINSEYFHKMISEAIAKKATEFILLDENLKFVGDQITEVQLHPVNNKSKVVALFHPHRWEPVVKFLRMLPEQPITVGLTEYKIEVFCEGHFNIEDESL